MAKKKTIYKIQNENESVHLEETLNIIKQLNSVNIFSYGKLICVNLFLSGHECLHVPFGTKIQQAFSKKGCVHWFVWNEQHLAI